MKWFYVVGFLLERFFEKYFWKKIRIIDDFKRLVFKGDYWYMNKDGLEDKLFLIFNIIRVYYYSLIRNGSKDVYIFVWVFERLFVKVCGLLGCCNDVRY